MFLWTRLLVPSELDLDLKIPPKNWFKIGPKSISRGIPARSRLQWRFLSRLRHLQARFQGLREVDFVYLITKQRTSLSYLQAPVVAIMQTTERAVTAIAVVPPWDHLLRRLPSGKTYLRHKFQRCQFGIFLANASCLGSYSERIYDKFSVSISIRLYSTSMLRFMLALTSRVHPDLCMYMHRSTLVYQSLYIYIYTYAHIYMNSRGTTCG